MVPAAACGRRPVNLGSLFHVRIAVNH